MQNNCSRRLSAVWPLRRTASWSSLFSWGLLCSALVFSVGADGAKVADCTVGSTAQQISCLKMRNAVLRERLTQLGLLKSISKQSETVKIKSRDLGLPDVLSTYGMNGKMSAVLVWMKHGQSLGSMITHAGSAIPGGWHVLQIDNGTVTVQKGAKTRTLLLSTGQPGGNGENGNQSHTDQPITLNGGPQSGFAPPMQPSMQPGVPMPPR